MLSQANSLSHNSLEQQEFWQKTALYLNQEISEHTFVIRPLGLECLTHAIEKKQLDFAITNPAQIIELEKTEGVAVISSLQSYFEGEAYGRYGALLIAHSSREDLSLLSDLKGQSVMAVSPTEFGGYQIIWRELLQAGITPEDDFFNLLFTNGSQENIVQAVLDEVTDVGIVRTGILEGLIEQHKINPNEIKVIRPNVIESYKLQHSSILYPEWSFIRLEHTSIVLAKKVSTVLKSMPKSNTEMVRFLPYYGWFVKEDFTTVHGLLRALKLPPYEPIKKIALTQVLKEYGLVIQCLLKKGLQGCVLLDVRMPRMNGMDLHLFIKKIDPNIPVIIVTGHADVPMAIKAMKEGAFDFIEKPYNDQHMLERIQMAIHQQNDLQKNQERKQEVQAKFSKLSKREEQVLLGILKSLPNKLIADELCISIKTVEAHRANLMSKLDVKTVAELVRLAIEAERDKE